MSSRPTWLGRDENQHSNVTVPVLRSTESHAILAAGEKYEGSEVLLVLPGPSRPRRCVRVVLRPRFSKWKCDNISK